MSQYEFWLTDDQGVRLKLIDDFFFASYTRSTMGFGTLELGVSYDLFLAEIQPVFRPDWRVEVWRSPSEAYPLRMERIYFLRKPKIYKRETDNVQVVVFYGRDPKDLLARRHIIQASGTDAASKTDEIDDMMKQVVREQMVYGTVLDQNSGQDNTRAYPQGQFAAQANNSLGPIITRSFADKNVLDAIKELKETSFQLYDEDPFLNRKIYFDVVEKSITGGEIYILAEDLEIILDESGDGLLDEQSLGLVGGFGFEFRTYADMRGSDRTAGLVFSVENGNLEAPWWSKDHLDEVNSVYVKGQGRGESRAVVHVEDLSRVNSSRWNRSESVQQATYETDLTALEAVGNLELNEGKPAQEFYATFLNTPGDESTPRSLYGIDWDLGDILPVSFTTQMINCEVVIVYVSIDENGKETILGRNVVN